MDIDVSKDVEQIKKELIRWRREFHRFPEVAFEEKQTSSRIREFLESLGTRWSPAQRPD